MITSLCAQSSAFKDSQLSNGSPRVLWSRKSEFYKPGEVTFLFQSVSQGSVVKLELG